MIHTSPIKNKALVTYRTGSGTATAACSYVPSPCAVVVQLSDGSEYTVPVTHIVSVDNPEQVERADNREE